MCPCRRWRWTAAWIAAYLILNLGYSLGLKRVVILDVFAIASFFVIRLLAGAAAVEVHPSVWLLLCGGLLALYLGQFVLGVRVLAPAIEQASAA